MANKILIDTNVILDYLLMREPFQEDADKVVKLCVDNKVRGCIAAHSIPNLFYILRKDCNDSERRNMLINICRIFDVEGIDRTKLINALNDDDFSDFEDCLQAECAKSYGADYIITRNLKDFLNSDVPAVTPSEFLQMADA
jgi:predicted nucleic acid-binding protein